MADSTSRSMSAHLCLMAWNEPMGRPNCTRTLAYSTDMSRQRWAPPTCSAARATAARSSTASSTGHPCPSSPISVASTPSNVSLACLRVWSMVDSAVRVSPPASGSTVNSETPPEVRAATITRSAVCPSSTYILTPSSCHEPFAGVAAIVIPGSSQRPFCSVKASVPLVSPEAICGRWACLAASSPQSISALAAITAEEK